MSILRVCFFLFPAAVVSLVSAQSKAANGCAEIGGVEPLLTQPRVLALGEVHGSRECPEFVAALACRIAWAGLPLRVGLEGDVDAAPFREFLRSAGADRDIQRLLRSPFWAAPPFYDGRSSVAALRMIMRLRTLRHAGADVDVFIVGRRGGEAEPYDRDYGMAESVLDEWLLRPDAIVVVLVGSGHAGVLSEKEQPSIGNSMAWHLKQDDRVPLISLWFWDPQARGSVVGADSNVPLENVRPFAVRLGGVKYFDGIAFQGGRTESEPAACAYVPGKRDSCPKSASAP